MTDEVTFLPDRKFKNHDIIEKTLQQKVPGCHKVYLLTKYTASELLIISIKRAVWLRVDQYQTPLINITRTVRLLDTKNNHKKGHNPTRHTY